jgi:ubiquinone/menaquinone biosynthesis C-methylase UbiE
VLERLLGEIGHSGTLLDLPCGFGRLADLLHRHADEVIEADFSPSMLALNVSSHGPNGTRYLQCSALAIPLADRAVDTVLSVRLNHHLDSQDAREQHVRELLRVAGRAAILTFFSASSLKNRLRQLRAAFGKRGKHTLRKDRVETLARDLGFEVRRFAPLSRIGSGHVFALCVRRG